MQKESKQKLDLLRSPTREREKNPRLFGCQLRYDIERSRSKNKPQFAKRAETEGVSPRCRDRFLLGMYNPLGPLIFPVINNKTQNQQQPLRGFGYKSILLSTVTRLWEPVANSNSHMNDESTLKRPLTLRTQWTLDVKELEYHS